MDPPAYTATVAATPTATKRSIEDTRALILANASIIKYVVECQDKKTHALILVNHSRSRQYPVELIIGKTKPPSQQVSSGSRSRSFTSLTSGVTIRVNDAPQSSSRSSSQSAAEATASGPDGERAVGRHYAALVTKHFSGPDLQVIILGEPQDTVEEALEWMLDRTEIIITGMLSRHRKQVGSTCCAACTRALSGEE